MKKNFFKTLTLMFALSIFVFACEDVKVTDPEIDTQTAEDNALSAKVISEVFSIINDGTSATKLASCATITYTVATKTLVIDFGTEGCTGDDGVTRKGIVTAVFTGLERTWEISEIATISFNNYYRNNTQLEGEIEIECSSVSPPSFTVDANNMVLTFSDAKTISWSASEDIDFEQADESGFYWRFNGGTVGSCYTRNGKTFSRTNVNLLSSPTCRWFIDGTLTMVIEDNTTVITFYDECGKINVQRNNLPAVDITLN